MYSVWKKGDEMIEEKKSPAPAYTATRVEAFRDTNDLYDLAYHTEPS
jgi:hypothetical protein